MKRANATGRSVVLALCLLCFFASVRCGAGPAVSSTPTIPGTPTSPNYARHASIGIQALQQWYRQSTGLYSTSGWWNAANAITVLANYQAVTGDSSYDPVLANTFTAAQKESGNFVNTYFDDDGWWALAWIDAYDQTGNTSYLSMAETIFAHIATDGWDNTTCGGGVWWSTAHNYKNAIPNELFLTIAAKLANRTSGKASAAYLKWARQEWKWFKASGMINAQQLVNDGLNSSNPKACVNNGKNTWTYNQGVILGGLVELVKADHDTTLLPQAKAIADAAIAHLTTPGGILRERTVSGSDTPQFKGIFMRNLMALYAALPGTDKQKPLYRKFVEVNAASILTNDQNSIHQFGALWQGPFDSADATRQTSALDALIAAAAMQ